METLPRTASHADLLKAATIMHRRTDRRGYDPGDVSEDRLAELARCAAAEGVLLRVVRPGDARANLASAITEADQFQRANPSYVCELARWTGRHASTRDGFASADTPPTANHGDVMVRQFDTAHLHGSLESNKDGAGTLLVLGTTDDDRMARLRAGEATSAVLLTATRLGLATCPLTQPLEIPTTREVVRTRVLHGIMIPQMVLRIGRPPAQHNPFPATTRRTVAETTTYLHP